MKTQNEKELAKHYLAHHAVGYSITYILKKSIWRYLIQIIVTIAGIMFIQLATHSLAGSMLIFGILIGSFARDLGWFKRGKKSWPFVEKIIKWDEVELIANK